MTAAASPPAGDGSLLVIIPAYNEEAALPSTLAELGTTLDRLGIDHRVVVVDDGSSDDTFAVARGGGAIALRLPYNLGIGGALRTGFRYAVEEGFDWAVQFDADGQHDPNEIPKLLAELRSSNLVIGSRFADAESTYEVGTVRRRAMRLLQLAVRLLSGRAFTDTSSGFRGFDRRTLALFARNYPVDYMESVEALVLACANGLRVAEVPVHMRIRSAGSPTTRRFRLAYHYVRLLFIIAVTATRRPRTQGAPP